MAIIRLFLHLLYTWLLNRDWVLLATWWLLSLNDAGEYSWYCVAAWDVISCVCIWCCMLMSFCTVHGDFLGIFLLVFSWYLVLWGCGLFCVGYNYSCNTYFSWFFFHTYCTVCISVVDLAVCKCHWLKGLRVTEPFSVISGTLNLIETTPTYLTCYWTNILHSN